MPLVECYRHFLGDCIKLAVCLTESNHPFDWPFTAIGLSNTRDTFITNIPQCCPHFTFIAQFISATWLHISTYYVQGPLEKSATLSLSKQHYNQQYSHTVWDVITKRRVMLIGMNHRRSTYGNCSKQEVILLRCIHQAVWKTTLTVGSFSSGCCIVLLYNTNNGSSIKNILSI